MDFRQSMTLGKLIRFTLPTVVMMLFSSVYVMVDGIFVSRFVGADALSSVNIIYPLVSVVVAVGVMFSTGGSAVVSRQMGEGNEEEARRNFTLITLVGTGIGLLITLVTVPFMEPVSRMLGASDRLMPYCVEYGRILMSFSAVSVLQLLFQMFFVSAGKPKLGLAVTILSGVANIVLDYLFIVVLDWGVAGAAWGTAVSYLIGGLPPLIYFARPFTQLYFRRPRWRGWVVARTMSNGSSEMVTNLAASITTFLFNLTMMGLLGEEGVSAITIVLYSQFLFTAIFIGFSNGAAPLVSHAFGRGEEREVAGLFRRCLGVTVVMSVVMVALAQLMAQPVVSIFSPEGALVHQIALEGFRIFAWNFLVAGVNIYASSYFTALSDGKTSALISFLRTFALQAPAILVLPAVMGAQGVWLAIPAAELITLVVSVACFFRFGWLPFGKKGGKVS